MKVYDYIIVAKKRNHVLVDTISRLMLMLSIAVFAYVASWIGAVNKTSILLAVLVLGMLAWWIYCYRQQQKGEPVFYRLGLLMATIGWLAISVFSWITILFFVAVLLEKQVKFPQEYAFDEEGIVINSLPKKYYVWAQVSNVILKDGIITIDLKNNKLIQKPIESDTSAKEEQEFNEFCKSRLNA